MNTNNLLPKKSEPQQKNDSKKENTNKPDKKKSIPNVDSLNVILNEHLFFFSS
tara:strand:+ start:252 stop:410 length:159 start_codon:yes stop_codon:yes gene_type:complete